MKLSKYIVFQLGLFGVIGLLCSVTTLSFAGPSIKGFVGATENISVTSLKEHSPLLFSYTQQNELSNNGDTEAHLRSRHKSKVRLSGYGAVNETHNSKTFTTGIALHNIAAYVSTLTRPDYYNFLFRYTLF